MSSCEGTPPEPVASPEGGRAGLQARRRARRQRQREKKKRLVAAEKRQLEESPSLEAFLHELSPAAEAVALRVEHVLLPLHVKAAGTKDSPVEGAEARPRSLVELSVGQLDTLEELLHARVRDVKEARQLLYMEQQRGQAEQQRKLEDELLVDRQRALQEELRLEEELRSIGLR